MTFAKSSPDSVAKTNLMDIGRINWYINVQQPFFHLLIVFIKATMP